MFYVYFLKSKKNSTHYIGCTSNLVNRIKKHNDNKIFYTKYKGPFEFLYYEAYKSKEDAFQRERNLKLRANAMTGLKRRIGRSLRETKWVWGQVRNQNQIL